MKDAVIYQMFNFIMAENEQTPNRIIFIENINKIAEYVNNLQFTPAFSTSVQLLDMKGTFSKNEIKHIKELSKRLKKIVKARKSWGISDGQILQPNDKIPALSTVNGIGGMMYGNTHYFVFLFIPLIPLGRYAVIDEGGGYSFHGKLELNTFQKIWRFIALSALIILVIYITAKIIIKYL
ncbi:MAG: hypothetical protein LBG46_05385 [Elusimicrobiota bacterium]|nr:hypothetical protein [Elusimicrobiota bacterium]